MKNLVIVLVFLSSFSLLADDCLDTRAALDIGSGTTKIKVALVNTCAKKIIKLLLDDERQVGYKQDLKESSDNKLSDKIVVHGMQSINELKALAQKFNPSSYVAAATSAFRTAANGQQISRLLEVKTGIKIHIISQEQEAKIGFAGASVLTDKDLKDIIVWDIGGGSMQITSYLGDGKYDIYKGKLASVTFKNHLIEEIQRKNPKKVKTPNPINRRNMKAAKRDAKIIAKITVPQSIQRKILAANTKVIGIGGVHFHSLRKPLGQKSYTLDMIFGYLKKKLYQNDQELGGAPYVETSISNLILVAGFMEGLNINSVTTGKVNMANGLLIMPELVK